MTQHPEVLWAQRSSESSEEKVRLLNLIFFLLLTIFVECSLYHGQSTRYCQGLSSVRFDSYVYLF